MTRPPTSQAKQRALPMALVLLAPLCHWLLFTPLVFFGSLTVATELSSAEAMSHVIDLNELQDAYFAYSPPFAALIVVLWVAWLMDARRTPMLMSLMAGTVPILVLQLLGVLTFDYVAQPTLVPALFFANFTVAAIVVVFAAPVLVISSRLTRISQRNCPVCTYYTGDLPPDSPCPECAQPPDSQRAKPSPRHVP